MVHKQSSIATSLESNGVMVVCPKNFGPVLRLEYRLVYIESFNCKFEEKKFEESVPPTQECMNHEGIVPTWEYSDLPVLSHPKSVVYLLRMGIVIRHHWENVLCSLLPCIHDCSSKQNIRGFLADPTFVSKGKESHS